MITTDRLSSFVNFMIERENIRIKKEGGESWPWTDDPILRDFKFTNVHRYDDRTSRKFAKLYRECIVPRVPPWQTLYCCGVLRYFGTVNFMNALSFKTLTTHDARELILRAGTMRRAGEKVFTSAYVITNGGRSEPKENVVADYLGGLWAQAGLIVTEGATYQSWEAMYKTMFKLPGFGGSGFMAKEVLQDFMMAYPEASLLDRNIWTPMGPGGRRGMNRMHDRRVDFHQSELKFISECIQLCGMVKDWWPEDWTPLSSHDVQFQLCEFDKYSRVLTGEGKPKSRYVRKE